MAVYIPPADLAPDASMGDGTVIWHLAQVLERAALGHDCDVLRGAYIGADRWRRPQTGEEYAERDGTLHPAVPA